MRVNALMHRTIAPTFHAVARRHRSGAQSDRKIVAHSPFNSHQAYYAVVSSDDPPPAPSPASGHAGTLAMPGGRRIR